MMHTSSSDNVQDASPPIPPIQRLLVPSGKRVWTRNPVKSLAVSLPEGTSIKTLFDVRILFPHLVKSEHISGHGSLQYWLLDIEKWLEEYFEMFSTACVAFRLCHPPSTHVTNSLSWMEFGVIWVLARTVLFIPGYPHFFLHNK